MSNMSMVVPAADSERHDIDDDDEIEDTSRHPWHKGIQGPLILWDVLRLFKLTGQVVDPKDLFRVIGRDIPSCNIDGLDFEACNYRFENMEDRDRAIIDSGWARFIYNKDVEGGIAAFNYRILGGASVKFKMVVKERLVLQLEEKMPYEVMKEECSLAWQSAIAWHYALVNGRMANWEKK